MSDQKENLLEARILRTKVLEDPDDSILGYSLLTIFVLTVGTSIITQSRTGAWTSEFQKEA